MNANRELWTQVRRDCEQQPLANVKVLSRWMRHARRYRLADAAALLIRRPADSVATENYLRQLIARTARQIGGAIAIGPTFVQTVADLGEDVLAALPTHSKTTLARLAERAAKAHAEDMEGRGYFSHSTPEGWSPSRRLSLTGASGYSAVGENIAVGQPTPQDVMADWMASSGHRANILNASYTHLGVGVAERAGGGPYWVQVFLRRP